MRSTVLFCSVFSFMCGLTFGASGNRFTVLDEFCDIYYPNESYPKLTTPQWVGEEGVEAVLVLAIDDMRDHKPYEAYLRPILERLKQIDGRAPVSIMSCRIDPNEPHLQTWLAEGVSLEAHTIDHPCPILEKSNFAAAKSTYDRCVDLFCSVPNSQAVAFRTPCMDGINSASPRLFAEIMMRTTEQGNFVSISSSIGSILTGEDPENPKELVLDAEGKPRFTKYILPGWINYIENYPYPYLIGNRIWEAPFAVPDDYEASRVFGDKSPKTVEDMKASIDAVVAKKGIWVMTFHPYQWFGNDQVIELIEHTVAKHGRKAKFLNLREVKERLEKNALGGQATRAANGGDHGVRLLDLNGDGYLDVVVGNASVRHSRIWNNANRTWETSEFPARVDDGRVRFGILEGKASAFGGDGFWVWDGGQWRERREMLNGLELDGQRIRPVVEGRDRGVRLRDINGDGHCEIIVSNPEQNAVFSWVGKERTWRKLAFGLPEGVSIVTETGVDRGLRFYDFNKDGIDDVIFSNEEKYGLWLGVPEVVLGFKQGWSRQIVRGKRGELPEIPMISRGGEFPNNGTWFGREMMWVQNEDTAKLPDLVDRVNIRDLLNGFEPAAKEPRAALESMVIDPDYAIELAAHEPAVRDPVAFEWGADGTLWVVEMRDYPNGINGQPGGVVKRLRDADGDGFYEGWSVFLQGLNFPSGVMPWRNGVLISAAPDILFAEDTNGDGQADRTEVLFRGFGEGNQQHRVNGFEIGLDNWIHGANGDSGGTVVSKKTGAAVKIGGRDFRFRPDSGEFEATSGQTQFQKRRDDWGNWFGGANYSWGWHYVIEDAYLARNPRFAVRSTYRALNREPEGTRVFPVSRLQQRFNDIGMAGHVTSACSFAPYRDELFGEEFQRSIFVSEPTHNLVHREVLEPEGVSFRSRRAPSERGREFLASSDPWFRPTTVKTGPDGALYLADMYRQFIEHPEWIPGDVLSRVDPRAGEDKGRIYRIRPKNVPLRKFERLDRLAGDDLARALNSPNGWRRDAVQRMVVEARPAAAAPILQELAMTSASAKVRLQALGTLQALGEVAPPVLSGALRDTHPAVREHAVKLAAESQRHSAIAGLSGDPDVRVRYQVALSLFDAPREIAVPALAKIARGDRANGDIINAVAVSSARFPRELLVELLRDEAGGREIERLVNHLVKATAETSDEGTLTTLARQFEQPIRDGVYSGWKLAALVPLLRSNPALGDQIALRARDAIQREGASDRDRLALLPLLGNDRGAMARDLELLGALVSPGRSPEVQSAAVGRLGQIDDLAVASVLLDRWNAASPRLRNAMLALLLKREGWTKQLLARAGAGELNARDLDVTTRQMLLSHTSAEIRKAAGKLFEPARSERDQVVAELLPRVSSKQGNGARGQALFSTHCAACHKIGQAGQGAGPNLAMLRDQTLETMLVAILDPSRAVEEKFRNYTIEQKNGDEYSGILLNESASSVTLMGITGVEQTILRREIASLRASDRSMMPDGFEQVLQAQDLADLAVFLRAPTGSP